MVEFYQNWLGLRLDSTLLAVGSAVALVIWLRRTRQASNQRLSGRIAALAVGIVALGAAGAEWGASRTRTELTAELRQRAAVHSHHLRTLGHGRIGFATSPRDPVLQAVHDAQREWLRLNPGLAGVFTFRNGDGNGVRVVSNPTLPASPGQTITDDPAPYRRALAGETFLAAGIFRNEQGAWVRVFAPVRAPTGVIEAGLVLLYPATEWQRALVFARLPAIGAAAFAFVGVLCFGTFLVHIGLRLRRHAEIERDLHNAKIAADEASRAKSDFLAVMSHEIRTPLNAVIGFANLLAESRLDEAQRGYVATITSEGLRLGTLVNDLLDLSKIEEGRLILERLPFSPVETAQEVLRLLNGKAQERNLELRFEAQLLGPLLVAGDPLRFRQILINLIDNALKFTPTGSVTLFLRWHPPEAGQSQGRLAVRVRDTGIGIPPEKLANIFHKFMQADTSITRRYGGTGLGLAICQRLVGLMGGTITVESAPGRGSEFAFTLPLTAVAPAAEPAGPAPEPAPVLDRPPTVLVVDDMETNRFLLEVFLRRNGFEPELAAGGEEAIRKAARRHYDAILMDLQMPDVDGYTAARRIRAAEQPGRRTLIIALTASIAKGTREKCLAAGMDEHLTKPLDLKRFRQVLHELISARLGSSPHGSPGSAEPWNGRGKGTTQPEGRQR